MRFLNSKRLCKHGFGFPKLFSPKVDVPKCPFASWVIRGEGCGSNQMLSCRVYSVKFEIAPSKVPRQPPLLLDHCDFIFQELNCVQPPLPPHGRRDVSLKLFYAICISHRTRCLLESLGGADSSDFTDSSRG